MPGVVKSHKHPCFVPPAKDERFASHFRDKLVKTRRADSSSDLYTIFGGGADGASPVGDVPDVDFDPKR